MSATEPTSQKLVTPPGRAGYAFVDKPSFKFNEAGRYSIQVTLTPTEAAPILEALHAMADQALAYNQEEVNKAAAQKKQKPKQVAKAALPVIENEDGTVTLKFGKTATYKPKDGPLIRKRVLVVDAQKQAYTGRVYQGSTVRVSGTMSPWFMPTSATGEPVAGARLQVEAVQVLNLADPTDAFAADFDADPEGFAAAAVDVEESPEAAHKGDF